MTKRSAVRGELIAYASFGKRMTPCMRQFSADGRAKVTDEHREMIRFGRTHDGFKSSVC